MVHSALLHVEASPSFSQFTETECRTLEMVRDVGGGGHVLRRKDVTARNALRNAACRYP